MSSVVDIKADVVRFSKTAGTCEFILENASMGLVGGALVTDGIGNTSFVKQTLDVVLTLGGSLSADRAANLNTHVLTFNGGKIVFAAPTTTYPNVNLPAGTAPSSPVTGDLYHTSGHLFFRDGSTTYDLLNSAANWDTVLALGGSFTADRTVDMAGHSLTFNNTLNVSKVGVASTVLDGYIATNTTASVSTGTPEYGPAYYSVGASFATTSKESGVRWYNKTKVSFGTQIQQWVLETNFNGGAYAQIGLWDDSVAAGVLTTGTILGTVRMNAPTITASVKIEVTSGFLSVLGGLQYLGAQLSGTITLTSSSAAFNECSGTFTVTLPTLATANHGYFTFVNTGAGTITISAGGTDNIKIFAGTTSATFSLAAGHQVSFSGIGSGYWLQTSFN